MKKLLHLICFIAGLSLVYLYLTTPAASPSYLDSKAKLSPNTVTTDHEFVSVLREINERNAQISSLICQNVDIKIKAKLSTSLDASLAFEREKKFRMSVKSFIGSEMDIGSNDTHFWFWSRRMKPPALHYAKHSDIHKTMLKAPLNPLWLIECMGIGEIKTKNVKVGTVKGHWAVIEERTSNGQPVTKVTLIDRTYKRIIAHYLYNRRGKMEASCEVTKFHKIGEHYVPANMIIIWYSEGVHMEWTLNNPRLDVGLDPENWEMPEMDHMIDMGED